MFSGCKKMLAAVAGISLSILGAATAQAGFTTVNTPWPGEASQSDMLSHAYGGSFVANGLNYSNGNGVTATRLDDSTNAVFNFKIASIVTIGKFSGWTQGLGYGNVDSPTQLFNVTGEGFNATGSVGAFDAGSSFSLVRTGQGPSSWSSDATKNSDGADHLISYLLTGLDTKNPVYVMFWEDAMKGRGDFDFNDFAIQVTAAGNNPVVVPLPAAAWSGIVTLAGGAAMTVYRKRRQLMA